jgi:NADH:ubiquinone oxidoreductase subunit
MAVSTAAITVSAYAPMSALKGCARSGWTSHRRCAIVRATQTTDRITMGLLTDIFTWWNGTTLGTRLHTAIVGTFVGEDEFGNRYYQNKDGLRRWVIYNGYAEASAIPPGWYGWIHKIVDELPTARPYQPHEWEKPHQPNLTGTSAAYRPHGSLFFPKPKSPPSDYEPWQPE